MHIVDFRNAHINQYVFCSDNPVMFVDPWGLVFVNGGKTEAERQKVRGAINQLRTTDIGKKLWDAGHGAEKVATVVLSGNGSRVQGNVVYLDPSGDNVHELQHIAEWLTGKKDPAGYDVECPNDPKGDAGMSSEMRAVRAENIHDAQVYENKPTEAGFVYRDFYMYDDGEWFDVPSPFGRTFKPAWSEMGHLYPRPQ